MTLFKTLQQLVATVAKEVRPKERLTVSEAAAKYRKLNNPGSYVGPWDNSIAPYLVEPMDELNSLDYTGMIFAGPARTGKSDMFFNWLCSTAITDPRDMMLVHMTQATARDWSQGDLARALRHSKDLGDKLTPGRVNDNVHDKRFLSGMRLLIKWPTITELSGKTIPLQWLMDYDRMDQDIDKEGTPFDLTRKRGQTFGRRAMCAAESSPGFEITNPKWIKTSAHEAPPTPGILSLYNRGDRRRWFWCCPHCSSKFEPDFRLLSWPETKDKVDAAEMATLDCPACGYSLTHEPGPGQPGKNALNQGGRWIKDGQVWMPDGSITGEAFRSDIASFWLKGPAAVFQSWSGLVLNYLKAEEEYEKTQEQTALKATVNVDQGLPYTPRGEASDRLPEDLKAKAQSYMLGLVPTGVRFLVATVDVQKNRFVVQVHGIGEGDDIWIIDRFEIKHSDRTDPERPDQLLWVNPGAYLEDWYKLIEHVLAATYPLGDGSGRRMGVKLTLCDSGGKEGVTSNAYDFYRFLKRGPEEGEEENFGWEPGMASRFQLVKGSSNKNNPRIKLDFPDSERKDRFAGARGEIPVLFMNTNTLKDTLDKRLDRKDPRGGRINFAVDLPDNFYTELTVEVRDPVKGWENPKRFRNESWDLLVYCLAGLLTKGINTERPNFWEEPPAWAEEWDMNALVFDPKIEDKPMRAVKKAARDFSAYAEAIA